MSADHPPDDKVILAYIAGFIDGEGCVTFHKTRKGIITPMLCITSTTVSVLKFVQSKFGGTIYDRPSTNPHWKPAYFWYLRGRYVNGMLEKIYPYLLTKQPQAELIFQFYCSIYTSGYRKGTSIPDSEKQRREALLKEMRLLNRRGPENRSLE